MEQKQPTHVAIIMDGNGRWAKEHFMPRTAGHRRGTKVLEKIINYADKIGIKYLTVYAFSTENWERPQQEVKTLLNLLGQYLDEHIKKADKENIRFHMIGDRESDTIPLAIREKIAKLEEMTKDKTGLCFNMAFNYGGRDELVRACKKVANLVKKGELTLEQLSQDTISSYLDTAGQPDPDLMIRTSGEIRTSNFLPWQLTYSEFYFTSCLWPEFTIEEFEKALAEYNNRKRRFGKSE